MHECSYCTSEHKMGQPCPLQQAQEERERAERETRWASQFECSVHGTCDWSMVSTAKTCMATLANGQPCTETLQRGPSPWDAAIERAEAAEGLAEQRGKALLAIKRSVSKGEMRRIAIQAAPAEAQVQKREGDGD